MEDVTCVRFLQNVLPQLHMRWQGFRRVRKQVCKRIQRRIHELELSDVHAYRHYLQTHTEEWTMLDYLCRVTVSRFYRDKVVLEHIRTEVLPELARAAINADETTLRGWSAGCAMGEEAYSLVLIWYMTVGINFPQLAIQVTGSDIDEVLLQRAMRGCYSYVSVKALAQTWLASAFTYKNNAYCLDSEFRNKANFVKQDIREKSIKGPFHIIFCRNMAFTYFDTGLQLEMLKHIRDKLVDGGALIIGSHECLPEGFGGFEQWSKQRAIFRKL